MYKSAILIGLFTIAVSAQKNITQQINELLPSVCHDACSNWTCSVSDCLTNLNATYTIEFNTSDLSSVNLTGNWLALPPCFCSEEAVEASESCLECASESLNLQPPVTAEDYSSICENPLAIKEVFCRYHSELSFCEEHEETQIENGEDEDETAQDDEEEEEEEDEDEDEDEETAEDEEDDEETAEDEEDEETAEDEEEDDEETAEDEEEDDEDDEETAQDEEEDEDDEDDGDDETPTPTPTPDTEEEEPCTVTVTATPILIPSRIKGGHRRYF
jgi:hypothetical protein